MRELSVEVEVSEANNQFGKQSRIDPRDLLPATPAKVIVVSALVGDVESPNRVAAPPLVPCLLAGIPVTSQI